VTTCPSSIAFLNAFSSFLGVFVSKWIAIGRRAFLQYVEI
jgi:hypothetical protein